MIIRNDDVAFDTDYGILKEFCELCDAYGHEIIQAITPVGRVRDIHVNWSNQTITHYAGDTLFNQNKQVYEYILSRTDRIAIHGLRHTHEPTRQEITEGIKIMSDMSLPPQYFVLPFNEGNYPQGFCGLHVLGKNCDRLETYFDNGTIPITWITYLHSWRLDGTWYTMKQLESFFKHMANGI